MRALFYQKRRSIGLPCTINLKIPISNTSPIKNIKSHDTRRTRFYLGRHYLFFLLPSLRVLYDWILKVQKESRFSICLPDARTERIVHRPAKSHCCRSLPTFRCRPPLRLLYPILVLSEPFLYLWQSDWKAPKLQVQKSKRGSTDTAVRLSSALTTSCNFVGFLPLIISDSIVCLLKSDRIDCDTACLSMLAIFFKEEEKKVTLKSSATWYFKSNGLFCFVDMLQCKLPPQIYHSGSTQSTISTR